MGKKTLEVMQVDNGFLVKRSDGVARFIPDHGFESEMREHLDFIKTRELREGLEPIREWEGSKTG
jgi:hypothetical protein